MSLCSFLIVFSVSCGMIYFSYFIYMGERIRELVILVFGDAVFFIGALWLTLLVRYLELPSGNIIDAHLGSLPNYPMCRVYHQVSPIIPVCPTSPSFLM